MDSAITLQDVGAETCDAHGGTSYILGEFGPHHYKPKRRLTKYLIKLIEAKNSNQGTRSSTAVSYNFVRRSTVPERTAELTMLVPVYFRDAGILHALLNLPDAAALRAHPGLGASWEGFALEQVVRLHGADASECHFWAAHTGAELDLLIVRGTRRTAFEFKYSSAPKTTRSMRAAVAALDLDRLTVVYPGDGAFPLTERIRVAGLGTLVEEAQAAAG